MIKLDKLFDVRYGVNLELNKMRIDSLYNRRVTIQARMGIGGVTLVRPSW